MPQEIAAPAGLILSFRRRPARGPPREAIAASGCCSDVAATSIAIRTSRRGAAGALDRARIICRAAPAALEARLRPPSSASASAAPILCLVAAAARTRGDRVDGVGDRRGAARNRRKSCASSREACSPPLKIFTIGSALRGPFDTASSPMRSYRRLVNRDAAAARAVASETASHRVRASRDSCGVPSRSISQGVVSRAAPVHHAAERAFAIRHHVGHARSTPRPHNGWIGVAQFVCLALPAEAPEGPRRGDVAVDELDVGFDRRTTARVEFWPRSDAANTSVHRSLLAIEDIFSMSSGNKYLGGNSGPQGRNTVRAHSLSARPGRRCAAGR